jgi:hypothetical protein
VNEQDLEQPRTAALEQEIFKQTIRFSSKYVGAPRDERINFNTALVLLNTALNLQSESNARRVLELAKQVAKAK